MSRRIFVVGFGLYGSIHGPTDYRVNIQVFDFQTYKSSNVSTFIIKIIHSETNTVSGQNETGFSCDGSWKTFRVMFKEPIEIMQNQFYTASATLIVSNGANRLRKLDTFLNEKLIKKCEICSNINSRD